MGSEFFKTDVIQILQYLLPGFVATWAFYGLTAHEKATPFERVVEALIFLVPVQVGVLILEAATSFVFGLGNWALDVRFTASFVGRRFQMGAKAPRPMPEHVIREADLLEGKNPQIDRYGRNHATGEKAVIKPLPPPPPPSSPKKQ